MKERIEQDDLFLGSAVVAHGIAPHMRDYDVVVDVVAPRPDGRGNFIEGRYRYRFTHCPTVSFETSVSDVGWRDSWDDAFVDFGQWEQAGSPGGYVWGVCWSEAYPGMSYIDGSAAAADWSRRLGHELHEVLVDTNAYSLRLVFHDLRVTRIATANPTTGELEPVD
jgi:hypothetical protein